MMEEYQPSAERQLDALLEALDSYSAAHAEYTACMQEDGYERGYYCWPQEQTRNERRLVFKRALDAYIDARIAPLTQHKP